MRLDDAYLLASAHRDTTLLGGDWRIRFNKSKTTAGAVDYKRSTITFSVRFIAELDHDEFEQIVLHELAHIMAGPDSNHGALWKAEAKALGYTGGQFIDPLPSSAVKGGGNGYIACGAVFAGVTYAYAPVGIVLLTLWAAAGLVTLWHDLSPAKQFETR